VWQVSFWLWVYQCDIVSSDFWKDLRASELSVLVCKLLTQAMCQANQKFVISQINNIPFRNSYFNCSKLLCKNNEIVFCHWESEAVEDDHTLSLPNPQYPLDYRCTSWPLQCHPFGRSLVLWVVWQQQVSAMFWSIQPSIYPFFS
jgi:hypothetical protein